jgi:hypothetical protein
MSTTIEHVKSTMEAYIDQTSVAQLLDALADVCRDKAEHVRVNRQDQNTARPWDRAAKLLDSLSSKIEV